MTRSSLQVKCELCGESMPPSRLEDHKANECALRQVPCRFCKVPTPFARLPEHENYCGSKSVVCDMCNKMVGLAAAVAAAAARFHSSHRCMA